MKQVKQRLYIFKVTPEVRIWEVLIRLAEDKGTSPISWIYHQFTFIGIDSYIYIKHFYKAKVKALKNSFHKYSSTRENSDENKKKLKI